MSDNEPININLANNPQETRTYRNVTIETKGGPARELQIGSYVYVQLPIKGRGEMRVIYGVN